jgi:hypothetical protein
MKARWLNHDRFARRAFVQLRRLTALAPGLCGIDRAPVDVERPFDVILGETAPE